MAQSPKTIVIFGATGQQGGSVLRAMKDDKRFVLKAATKNTDSDSAKKLAAQGIELVKVTLDDAASCKAALKGAYGAFLVTNYLEHFDLEREIRQGKNAIDAAKENGLQHLVFSGMRSPKEQIGKEGCHHFESKKLIVDYIKEKGVPHTIVEYAMYYENFSGESFPRKNEQNEYVVDFPMGSAPLDMVPATDAGEVTHQVFVHGDEYKGKYIPIAVERLTLQGYADVLTKKLGHKFVPGQTTVEQFSKLPFPLATDMAVMFDFYASGKCTHDFELTRKLHPNILSFEQWVDKNLDALKAKCV